MRLIIIVSILCAACLLGYGYTLNRGGSHTDYSTSHDHHNAPVIPWESPTRQPDRIVLNWSDNPATTLSVTWRTDTTITQATAQIAVATPAPRFDRNAQDVEAATESLDLSSVANEHIKAHYHSVTFTNLTPSTLYAYRVGTAIPGVSGIKQEQQTLQHHP